MLGVLKRLVREEQGQGMVEYVLILMLIFVVCLGAYGVLGTTNANKVQDIANQI